MKPNAKHPTASTQAGKYAGSLTGVSLFTGGGIGDLAVRASGVEVLVASELLEDRAEVYRANYPETEMIIGDIRQSRDRFIDVAKERLDGRSLDILVATPPCQGMSRNGRGKLLSGIRAGVKPKFDERNTLALEAVAVAKALQPDLIVFENVPEMEFTLVENEHGDPEDLMEMIARILSPLYRGRWEVVEFADYGVPQRRQRLITVFAKRGKLASDCAAGRSVMPERTHAPTPSMFTKPWVTVDEALRGVPPLDAGSESTSHHSSLEFHHVPLLDEGKYFWVSNTPSGKGAFDNQCVNPRCGHQENATHGAAHDKHGINRASKTTPVHCVKCGSLLPRPWVVEDGQHRLMSGFTSAYKRMRGDLPSSALTRNLSYACSDQKLHPHEHRVLSLHEAFILHTVSDYGFGWRRADGKRLSDKTIREIIGESIPPKGLERILQHLVSELRSAGDSTQEPQERIASDAHHSSCRKKRHTARQSR